MAETPADTAPIRAILLIPATGDPLGLLREGPCRARPPTVYLLPGGRIYAGTADGHSDSIQAEERGAGAYPVALVLAWDAYPAREGIARALVALATAEDLADEIDTGIVPMWRPPDVLDEPGWWLECPASVVRYVATAEAAQSPGTRHVPTIEDWPDDLDDRLVPAWTLATACAARGIGRVEVVRG